MSTLGTMVAEIREELRRSGMDNAIKRGIGAGVLFHRDKRFKWNETSFTFSTVAGQADYTATDAEQIGRLAVIDVIKVTSPEWIITPRTIEYIRSLLELSSGTPQDYAYFDQSIIFSPSPSTVLTIAVDGVLELKDSSQPAGSQIITKDNILTLPDSYSTEWFGAGYELIKAWAKGYISLHHLRNADQAGAMFSASSDLRTDQENQLGRLGGSGFVRPTRF